VAYPAFNRTHRPARGTSYRFRNLHNPSSSECRFNRSRNSLGGRFGEIICYHGYRNIWNGCCWPWIAACAGLQGLCAGGRALEHCIPIRPHHFLWTVNYICPNFSKAWRHVVGLRGCTGGFFVVRRRSLAYVAGVRSVVTRMLLAIVMAPRSSVMAAGVVATAVDSECASTGRARKDHDVVLVAAFRGVERATATDDD